MWNYMCIRWLMNWSDSKINIPFLNTKVLIGKLRWFFFLSFDCLIGKFWSTRLFKMTVRVLTTCHTQYNSDSSICIFLFNRTTLPVSVTYHTGALYVHPLWFYKHQHDNPVRSKLSVTCQRWWFQWRFWLVPIHTHPVPWETVHTAFEWNCQMVVVS